MLHSAKACVMSPIRAAARARGELQRLSRPPGSFAASRYFRSVDGFGFLNVGTQVVREMARRLVRDHQPGWTVNDALAFANALISDRYLEVKGSWHRGPRPAPARVHPEAAAGVETMARLERYLRANGPRMPRTTVRYAIERFSPGKRRELLAVTKQGRPEGRPLQMSRVHG
jgi:hypothetical protein